MKNIALYHPNGKISERHSLDAYHPKPEDEEGAEAAFYDAQAERIAAVCGGKLWTYVSSFTEGYIDPATREFRSFPEQPSPVHVWDWTAHAWLANTDAAAAQATRRIEDGRVARTLAPIVFDGKRLDGDQTAQENVKSKLAELSEREALGDPMPAELCFWRDADNQTHTWPGHAEYRVWLGGFTIALAQRGTEAYAWAWAQKSLRDAAVAAGDVAALQALPTP